MEARWLPVIGAAALLLLVPLGFCVGLSQDTPTERERDETEPAESFEGDEVERDEGVDGESDVGEPDETEPEPRAPPEGLRTLSGTVRDASGKVVEGAVVMVDGSPRDRDVTNRDGWYRLHQVGAAALTLTLRAPGYAERQVEVEDGEANTEEEHDVRLEAGSTAAGVVVAPDGQPVADATVLCSDGGEQTVSDRSGRFELPAPAVGCDAVASHASHGASRVVSLAAGPHNTLTLTKLASISGVVVSADDEPVTSFNIAIDSHKNADGLETSSRYRQTFSHPQGRFEVARLAAGSYVLSVGPRGREITTKPIVVAEGEQRSDVRIVLP